MTDTASSTIRLVYSCRDSSASTLQIFSPLDASNSSLEIVMASATFSVVGSLDLLNALRHLDVAQNFGAALYIPTFLVPLLLVTHYMIFARLLKRT